MGFFATKCVPQAKKCGSRVLQRRFYATKYAPQAKILPFQNATKRILPYKMSATGDFFSFRVLKRGFYVRKYAPQAKILRFHEATNDI